MVPSVYEFRDELLKAIIDNPKTSYGKNELQLFIMQVYSTFLERYID